MTRLDVALFNYKDGGLRSLDNSGFTQAEGWEFDSLRLAFAEVQWAPALILLNEANRYGYYGSVALMAAADALSEQLGRVYDARLGYCERGDYGPALFYDPNVIRLHSWGDTHHTVHEHWRNVAVCSLRSRREVEFRVSLHHWSNHSSSLRLVEAKKFDHLANSSVPCLLGGDLNTTASGAHLPQRDWTALSARKRQRKGIQQNGHGTAWVADTAPVDHLIGWWDEKASCRQDGVGFHALAEVAWQQGMPTDQALISSVNDGIEVGEGLLIDWLIVNEAWKNALIPNTYQVHIPPAATSADYPSDHRLITASLEI